MHTSLNVTGRPAQLGRGLMSDVSAKLIGIFATNLADLLAAGTVPAPSRRRLSRRSPNRRRGRKPPPTSGQ